MLFLRENIDYPTVSGRHVLSGARQSIPSSNIDSCAGDSITFPVVAEGHTNRPFSRRLENRHAPKAPLSHAWASLARISLFAGGPHKFFATLVGQVFSVIFFLRSSIHNGVSG